MRKQPIETDCELGFGIPTRFWFDCSRNYTMKRILVLSVLICFTCAQVQKTTWKNVFEFPHQQQKKPILRIIGGQEAAFFQFPYQVGLYVTKQLTESFCGGSLISANYVLTAAHCAEGAISINVILGSRNISDDSEPNRQRLTSSTYLVHPGWDSGAIVNDIALIKLPTSAVINDAVKIIQLPYGSDSYSGNQGVITGWGKTTNDQTIVTDILHYVNNTILSNTDCKSVDSNYNGIIQSTHLCLSGNGKTGICKGDSGGPLVTNGIQVGISSFNYKNCEASKPSVFTRISEFKQWIKDNSDVIF